MLNRATVCFLSVIVCRRYLCTVTRQRKSLSFPTKIFLRSKKYLSALLLVAGFVFYRLALIVFIFQDIMPSTNVPIISLKSPTAVGGDIRNACGSWGGFVQKVKELVESFYEYHTEIKESHGWNHIAAVLDHSKKAITVHKPPLSERQAMLVLVAALLHDVDDHKYFSKSSQNAIDIMAQAELDNDAQESIMEIISLVSCSVNRNNVPDSIRRSGEYWRLIPRWADRLEAVGAKGVLRCFQYNKETGQALSSEHSPRAATEAEVWEFARPERFANYNGDSTDMISHYYDKLLHVACPPSDIVHNVYLEQQAQNSSKELVEVCLRFGKTGVVDENYIETILG